jgi:hypothetical protein
MGRPRPHRTPGITLLVALIFSALAGCETLDERSGQELAARYGPNPPAIEAVFSPREVPPRSVWRIYLKGEDPDGDLSFIYILVLVPWGQVPIRLKVDPDQGHVLSGYLEFNTWAFVDFSPLWLRMAVTLEDRAGHRSESVELAYSFYAEAEETRPPQGMFQERFLGRMPLETLPKAIGPGI